MSSLLVVGAGLYGLTVARQAAESGRTVTIIDSRNHIGGNSYSEVDPDTGIEIHKYGSHIFHTSNERVWEYVNRFTSFTNYEHRVFTKHDGQTYPMPINLATINQLLRTNFTPAEARELIEWHTHGLDPHEADNLEDKALALIGPTLYNAFIRDYTEKQWQTDPRELPADIITRLPIRYNYDNRYFSDKYQGLPMDGYAAWMERMVDHPKIEVQLNTDYFDLDHKFSKNRTLGRVKTIYTGPIDRFFGYGAGRLGWRTLDFETTTHDVQDFQGTSVMNYADADVPYTRIHEFKHFHPERKEVFDSNKTVVVKEYSRFANGDDEPYYPINAGRDRELLTKYRQMSTDLYHGIYFGGRLGSYQYLDMHMAIASALSRWDTIYSN